MHSHASSHGLRPFLRRVARLLLYVLRALPTALSCHQRQYITVKRLDRASRPAPALPKIECLMVDSVEALRAVGWAIPGTFRDSVMDLEKRVARGCVVCLAWRPRDDGAGPEVIGYEIAERGVFSALGRRIAVADDVVFSHHAEVLPEYRGQRIHGAMFAARDDYFRRRGGRIVCGVCLPQNHASLQALRRDGAITVGTVERIALFGDRFVWNTSVERIHKALSSDADRAAGSRAAVPPKPAPRWRSVNALSRGARAAAVAILAAFGPGGSPPTP